jgi:hypothetical protein
MTIRKVTRNADGSLPPTHPILGVSYGDVFRAVYRVRIRFDDRVEGGIPKDGEAMEAWLKTKGFLPDEVDAMARARRAELKAQSDDAALDSADAYVEEEITRTWSGFTKRDGNLVIEGRQIKAMFRECATELKITTSVYAFKQRLQHGFFMDDAALTRNGQPLSEPDGYRTKVVHAWTKKGKIAAFSRHDYVYAGELEFTIKVIQADVVTADVLKRMLVLAEEMGLGANRSQGEGKFTVLEFEQVR